MDLNKDNNKVYVVNWSNYSTHVTKAFDKLFSQSEFVDVTICCEGHKLNAHKMVLAACSTYFRVIFHENPCKHPVIILKGVKFDILQNLMQFMYSGEVSVDPECFGDFIKTAELLEISGLSGQNQEKILQKTADLNETVSVETDLNEKELTPEPNEPSPPKKKRKRLSSDTERVKVKLEPLEEVNFEEDPILEDLDHKVDITIEDPQIFQTTRDFFKAPETTSNTNNKGIDCEICGKSFIHPYSLKQHKAVHLGNTSCPICNQVLSRKYHLKLHLKSRHNVTL